MSLEPGTSQGRQPDFGALLASGRTAIYEGSVYERLRRDPDVQVDPFIYHASLVYTERWADVLAKVHREYISVGQRAGLATLALTDTWRASQERIDKSAFRGRPVNQDNVRFLRSVAAAFQNRPAPVFVGGHMGPRGDAYTPEEAPDRPAACHFHRPQIEALAEGGVDFLQASTLPALKEAMGIADIMAVTGLPYILSFVIRADGCLLDGTPLADAIPRIDSSVSRAPAGYGINCVYPTVLAQALEILIDNDMDLVDRVIGFASNTSSRDPKDLDGRAELLTEDPDVLAGLMLDVHRRFGVRLLGGCCGTDTSHIASLGSCLRAH